MSFPIKMSEELIENISKYRLSLDNQVGINQILLTPTYKNIVVKQILENFTGLNFKYGDIIKSGDYNFFLKNLKTFLYAHFKLLKTYSKEITSFQKEIDSELNRIENFYLNSLSNYDSIKKGLRKEGSEFIVVRDFKQRNSAENYDLIDFKNKDYFQLNELAEVNLSSIESKIKQSHTVVPIKASILGNSEDGEKVERSKETSFLWRKDKRFKYIVYKEEKVESAEEEKATLSIVFDFGFVQNINRINIDEGSYLPGVIREDYLEFLNGETWEKINVINKNKKLRKTEFTIASINTQKIKIKIEHFKSLNKVPINSLGNEEKFILESISPENNLNSEIKNYNIYDISLDEVSFHYRKFKNRSIYREGSEHIVEKLSYVNLEVEKVDAENCFVESELEIQYYLNGKNWNWKIIPVPTSYKIEEVLFRKENNFLITFPIKSESFKLKTKNGRVIDSNLYEIKIINSTKENLYRNYYIEVDDSVQSQKLFCEYTHKERIEYEDCFFENGRVKFENSLLDKKAILRPRFIFRNYGKSDVCSSIKSYALETNENLKKENVSTRYKILKGQ